MPTACQSRTYLTAPLWAVWFIALLAALPCRAQLQPFLAPAQTAGSMMVKLHPMENVTAGSPTLVTFGIPFPRGSITASGLTTVRVLRNGTEIPAHVEALTPWRHLTNTAVDGQSVRIARIQLQHSFSVTYPQSEAITVEWGSTARTQDVPTLTDPQFGWHTVTSGSFVAADGIKEPDVYALLPKQVLTQGVLSLRRHEPFADAITTTRDDPVAMDAIEHWPGYEEADHAFKNNFFTSVNEDDSRLTTFGDGQLCDYKRLYEPWLYDRSSTFFVLYLKTGFLRPLREAVRATQFYRSKLYGSSVTPASSAGLFKLKALNPVAPNGGNDAMYSYAECFAYDHWLTGNPLAVEPIRWVAATHNAQTEPTHWTPTLGIWTERHTSFCTLANLVAFEVTGESLYRQSVLTQVADYIWHQNGADGQIPANRLDGGLYHYGRQHGDGEPEELIASHWMMSLTMDAMTRVYGVSEDPAIASFIIRGAHFQSQALLFDADHEFDTYPGALHYPGYMIRYDGQPDLQDGRDASAINHSLEVGCTVAWGAYFQHLLHGVPDPAMEAAARDLYSAYDAGVNHWIRPAAPPLGFTAFRVNPWRKFSWEHRPGSSLSWLMKQVDVVSPPPVVTITSPAQNTRYTAPATIQIEAQATSANSTIEKVEFFAGATKLGEDTEAPYTFQMTGVIANLQGYVITAKATTALGVIGQSAGVVLEVISPTRPTLTITGPMEGAIFTAPANVTLQANAIPQGSSPIARVIFMREGVPLFEDTEAPYSLTLPNLLAGDYEYEIRAFDILGGYDLDFVSFRIDTPTPPQVTLTAPTAGDQTANGSVLHLAATASAPGSAITRVVFLADNVPVGEDETAPYEYDLPISQRWEIGSHQITARAVETNGGIATSSVQIENLDLEPLTVSFESPAPNQEFNVPAEVFMQASASAPGSNVTMIEFYANGQLVSTDTEAPFTASFSPYVRQWDLTARAYDNLHRVEETYRTIYVAGPAAPTVTLTSPTHGAILVTPASVTLTANANAPAATITRVRFYEGGTLLGEDTEPPFSVAVNNLSLGDHTFYAVAYASTGRDATSTAVTVTVGTPNAPVVQVTAPRFPGPQVGTFTQVTFSATATHTGSGSIDRVEFWLDGSRVTQDFTAPYTYDWQVGTNYGFHILQARAFDLNQVEARSSNVQFEIMQPPIIAMATPLTESSVYLTLPVNLTATVTRGTYSITEVRYLINDAPTARVTTAPYTLQWIPPTAGTYAIKAQVFDSRGLSPVSDPITVTANQLTVLQLWRITHFSSPENTGMGADTANPDGDALSNLFEWILAADPMSIDSLKAPQLQVTASHITLSFDRTDDSESSTALFARWSDDLAAWNEVPIGPINSGPTAESITVSITENGTAPDHIIVTLPRTGSTHHRFLSLRATMP